jgi:hypothetical protein
MEALVLAFITLAALGALVAFDLLALRYGADSRGTIGDDHQRSLGR